MSKTTNEAKTKQDAMERLAKNKRNIKSEAESLAFRLLAIKQKPKNSQG